MIYAYLQLRKITITVLIVYNGNKSRNKKIIKDSYDDLREKKKDQDLIKGMAVGKNKQTERINT